MKTRCMCCGAERKLEKVKDKKRVYWVPRRCFQCCVKEEIEKLMGQGGN